MKIFYGMLLVVSLFATGCRKVAYESGEIVTPPWGYTDMIIREPDSVFAPSSIENDDKRLDVE